VDPAAPAASHTYLQEENRVLKLTSTAAGCADRHRTPPPRGTAHPLGRKRLKEIAAIATPDTLLRCTSD